VKARARGILYDLLVITGMAAAASVLFIVGDLIVHGRVNW
jgi:hypothetical protein